MIDAKGSCATARGARVPPIIIISWGRGPAFEYTRTTISLASLPRTIQTPIHKGALSKDLLDARWRRNMCYRSGHTGNKATWAGSDRFLSPPAADEEQESRPSKHVSFKSHKATYNNPSTTDRQRLHRTVYTHVDDAARRPALCVFLLVLAKRKERSCLLSVFFLLPSSCPPASGHSACKGCRTHAHRQAHLCRTAACEAAAVLSC